jgi:hypothetical protein
MKKFGIVVLLYLIATLGAAQGTSLSLGLRTYFGLSQMAYGQNRKEVPYTYRELRLNESFSFGIEAHMPLSNVWGLVTGIQYSERGFGLKKVSNEIVRYNYTYIDYNVGIEYQLWRKIRLKTGIEISNLRRFDDSPNFQDIGEYRVDPASVAVGMDLGVLYYINRNIFAALQFSGGKLGSALIQDIRWGNAVSVDQYYINPMFSMGYRYHFKPRRMEEEPITEDASN